MKSSISSVDLQVLSRELNDLLVGARFDKAYSLVNGSIKVRFHKSGVGSRDLIATPNFVCVSSFDYPQLEQPDSFAMGLRKYLEGLIVNSVAQHEFDRILEFGFEGNRGKFTLIVELFSTGNVILCDGNKKIIGIQRRQKWKDRILTPGREYVYPPSAGNPLALDSEKLKTILRYSEKGIAAALASLGLGGFYAEEVCLNAGVDKTRTAGSLSQEEVEATYRSLRDLIENTQKGVAKPCIILSHDESYIDVAPFDFKMYEMNVKKPFSSFNEAVDEY
ncbi:MAG: NFACT family protein, partial [Candidatus Altiarchaeota archaeon]